AAQVVPGPTADIEHLVARRYAGGHFARHSLAALHFWEIARGPLVQQFPIRGVVIPNPPIQSHVDSISWCDRDLEASARTPSARRRASRTLARTTPADRHPG